MNGSSHCKSEIREFDKLDLPDSDFDGGDPPRMTPTEYMNWCEEMMRWYPALRAPKERPPGPIEEFAL